MAQGPTVEFGDVFVVRETKTALLCRVGAKFHCRRPFGDGVRRDGLACRVAPLPESRFCFSHDTTTASELSVSGLHLNPAVSD